MEGRKEVKLGMKVGSQARKLEKANEGRKARKEKRKPRKEKWKEKRKFGIHAERRAVIQRLSNQTLRTY